MLLNQHLGKSNKRHQSGQTALSPNPYAKFRPEKTVHLSIIPFKIKLPSLLDRNATFA